MNLSHVERLFTGLFSKKNSRKYKSYIHGYFFGNRMYLIKKKVDSIKDTFPQKLFDGDFGDQL